MDDRRNSGMECNEDWRRRSMEGINNNLNVSG